MLVLNLIFLAYIIARIIATTEHSCEELNLTSVTLIAENGTVSITCCGNRSAGVPAGVYVFLHGSPPLGPEDYNGLDFPGEAPSGCKKVTFPLAQGSCNLTVSCKTRDSPFKNFSMEDAMDYCSFPTEGSTQDMNLCHKTTETTSEADPTTTATGETDGSTSSTLFTTTYNQNFPTSINQVVRLVTKAVVPAAVVVLVVVVLSFVTAALIILYKRNRRRNERATRDEIATEEEQEQQQGQEEELPPFETSVRQMEEEQYPTVGMVYDRRGHECVDVDELPGPNQGGNCKEFTSLNLQCETNSPQYQQCSDQSPRLTGQAVPTDNSYQIYKDCSINLTVITEQPGKK